MSRRRAGRRYLLRFGAAMAAYVVLLVGGVVATQTLPGGSAWRYGTVLAPVPAVVAAAWALWRLVVESDELQSRRQLESLGIAVAGTVVTTFTYGMLQLVGAPPLSWLWVTAVVMAWFGVGALVTSLRYR